MQGKIIHDSACPKSAKPQNSLGLASPKRLLEWAPSPAIQCLLQMMEPHNLGEGPCILARLFGWNVGSNNNCNNLAREREREREIWWDGARPPNGQDTNVAPTGGKSYGVQV